jgi:hypothetical protein
MYDTLMMYDVGRQMYERAMQWVNKRQQKSVLEKRNVILVLGTSYIKLRTYYDFTFSFYCIRWKNGPGSIYFFIY